ncbi:MAG: PEP-utilizing enzyme, partial [Candidatus Woesearchaeota archaeon]|nr:PEP-utilizing enzyme [Candidatus Woesearchaeota archaeon]
GFANEFAKHIGIGNKKILTVYEGYHVWFYFGEKDSYELGEHIVNKLFDEEGFALKVNEEIVKEADKLRKFALEVPEEGVEKLTNKELWYFIKKHDEVHTEYYTWCWIPVAADMFHNNLTDKLMKYLEEIGIKNVSEVFGLLTQPTRNSLIQDEQEEFLEVASQIQKDKKQSAVFKEFFRVFEEKEAAPYGLKTHTKEYEDLLERKMDLIRDKMEPKILRIIQDHYEKYFYVKFLWIGKEGVNSFDYYLKELVKFIGQGADAEKLLREKRKDLKDIIPKRKAALLQYKIEGKWLAICDAFGDFMVTKIYRRYAQVYALYRMQPILEEICKRLKISLMQSRFMLTREFGDALLKDKIDRDELTKRTESCVYYVEKGNDEVFTGQKAEEFKKLVAQKEVEDVDEFSGQTGCIGKAAGEVKIVIRPADMQKMNDGDILVSIATDPDIVPAMKKAAAFVTEQGGVTSHAAIVAREMGKPCVIGTKIATRVLKDGDYVEVDATKGVVKIISKAKDEKD